MVTFFETNDSISNSDISELESYVGLEFPSDYKDYLLKYNGGRCSPDVFSFIENDKETNSSVDWFYGIHDDGSYSLKSNIDIFKIEEKRMPKHILPIAQDPFGNQICISCGSGDYGKVYFWDHENEVDYFLNDDNDYTNLYYIADGFSKFLDSLISFEDIDI